MGRRASVAAAALTIAWCAASVMSRTLLPAPPARTTRDTHSWHTNAINELLQEEEEEVAPREGQEAAPSRLQQRADNSPDYLLESTVDYSKGTQRLLLDDDPELTPGLVQGDMAGITIDLLPMNNRLGIKWEKLPERRWPNATVPYVISELYGSNEKQMILTALYTLDFLTCIKFVPWDTVMPDYLLIWPMEWPSGCWSYVGRKGGKQILSLQPPDSVSKRCFISLGKPIHELLHALGVFHEQSRPDRDDHVDIITENIIPKFMNQFSKQAAENVTFPLPYDYKSVMHYGSRFFSYDNFHPTIVPKVKGVTIGQRIMISQLDCLKLNDLYGCLDDPFNKEKYTGLCMNLGY